MVNGINLEGLQSYVDLIKKEPNEAVSSYRIQAEWQGGVKTKITAENQCVGSTEIQKDFIFNIDEPVELLGSNSYPTPQDYLFGGLAGCMMVGFVVGASERNIILESVKLTIKGNLNLLGFLNIDPKASVGFEKIEFNFEVNGNGSQKDYDEIIAHVQQFSPNYRTISDAVVLSLSK
ncbi:OsmC family protein [Chryseobacterium sp. JK1]|uniref:OsmC family protein n=1 Tax=Chryseobacterium sp. JK1 TaxID=874294 RepID=UPI003D69D97E